MFLQVDDGFGSYGPKLGFACLSLHEAGVKIG
jgi:hypothetical protein